MSSYENGTTSDQDGEFSLALKNASNTPVQLKISCVGYQDTIISVNASKDENLKVLLEKRAYALPEVTIRGEGMVEQIIGLPGGTILKNTNGELTGLLPSNSAGLSSGVFIELPGKNMGVLKSIEYFILPRGKPNTPFMLRFLEAKEPVQPNRVYSEDLFTDLLKEPIITSGKAGQLIHGRTAKNDIDGVDVQFLIFDLYKNSVIGKLYQSNFINQIQNLPETSELYQKYKNYTWNDPPMLIKLDLKN
ncbi:carboxypeptidase-like regulatory domain-containing protein [Membranicola marinus]|uniref:Carboxypeptidase-like regulatory domain-containing protein n=1 Tax=Membranihabitans marinus TaxID=1227546 RepID=A0A953LD17_9BACT|nr:carboxypeptidase-like regulatory domain-containing protein [Membranihabitans marinus]MBY5958379.1 carboxypeptidase-like regulatory domain-containing protein [Membranihabitans marinus]